MKYFFSLLFSAVFTCNSQPVSDRIVLINVGSLSRGEIAQLISCIDSLSPKVIGIDLQFSSETNYQTDLQLVSSLVECKSGLVMVSVIDDFNGIESSYRKFTLGSLGEFTIMAKTGFANLILENEEVKTLKYFSTHERVGGKVEYNFGVRTAMEFDSTRAIEFVEMNNRKLAIDYQEGRRKFKVISHFDVLKRKVPRQDIEGKIVLVGYVGPLDEDKFFSPLNKKVKPLKPDVYGLEYYAYVIEQVLR